MKYFTGIFTGVVLCASITPFAYSQENKLEDEHPAVSGQATYTVSGQGYWHREVLSFGGQPPISAYDSNGNVLQDGVYRYELRSLSNGVTSSPRQMDLLRGQGRVKVRGGGKSRGRNTTAGTFKIQGGQVVLQ